MSFRNYAFCVLTHWTAADSQALAYLILAAAAVTAGVWSLINYKSAQRSRSADWTNTLIRDFYLDERVKKLREDLEYSFVTRVGPLLDQRITDKSIPLTDPEMELLANLDTLLNYFEMVLYLREEHRIAKNDWRALFSYWLRLISDPAHAPLRRYISHFGFRLLTREIGATDGVQVTA